MRAAQVVGGSITSECALSAQAAPIGWNVSPEVAAAVVRAIAKTHAALKKDVTLATAVGNKLFPPSEAALIAELIRRDLPYYDTTISREFVAGMNRFARDIGILDRDVSYEQVVAGSPTVRADRADS